MLFYFCSGEEFLNFLKKLNKECSKLTISVQAMNKHFLSHSHKVFNQIKKRKKIDLEYIILEYYSTS